ncbi:MAG: EF-hand domain-containing protein, partial [Phycisphaerales bacterium]
HLGVCQSGPPRTCDDALACTVDTCHEAEDVCVHTPAECNNDGVCDSPCESMDNCPADCAECPCVLDQDGDGLIKIQDVLNVVTCAEGETPAPPLTCDQADLNCDGQVDYCDASRVVCAFYGHPNCCEAEFVCGACCNSGLNFDPCLVISEEFCYSSLIEEGDYLGDGTVCDPWPCDATACTTHGDCDDGVVCTNDSCNDTLGSCECVPDDTLCDDGNVCTTDWCSPHSGCRSDGTRATGPCDDGNACTTDDVCHGDAEGTCQGVSTTAAPQPGQDGVIKNRYLSFASGNPGSPTAVRVRFVDLPSPFEAYEGRIMWVGEPGEYCENSGQDIPPQGGCGSAPGLESPVFVAASLQCDPYYTDWNTYGTIHVHHRDIIPLGAYELQEVELVCDRAQEGSFSAPLELAASKWGDIVGDCLTTPCSPPDGTVGIPTDLTALVDKFKNLAGAPTKARADLEPATPDLVINVADMTYCVDAFRGFEYPFGPGPDPCGQ